jgi:hypothetical protein
VRGQALDLCQELFLADGARSDEEDAVLQKLRQLLEIDSESAQLDFNRRDHQSFVSILSPDPFLFPLIAAAARGNSSPHPNIFPFSVNDFEKFALSDLL